MLLNGKKQHHLQKKNNAGQPRQIQTNNTDNTNDENQKSSIQNLDLLSMIEKSNAETRLCTDK